ncbi:nuclear transport factor 2 family protein [Sphingomonas sp. UYP23]
MVPFPIVYKYGDVVPQGNRHIRRIEEHMSDNLRIARRFLEGMGKGLPANEIGNLFDERLSFEIQGDPGAFPWIGTKKGRKAFEEFIVDLRLLTEPVTFEVEDLLESSHRVGIVGALMTRVKATEKVISSQFAIFLTIEDGLIARFQMFEDSFAVSNMTKP